MTATRVYAVDAPELVFSFYLERPVTILSAYQAFAAAPTARPCGLSDRRGAGNPNRSLRARRVATATAFAIIDGGHPQPEAARALRC